MAKKKEVSSLARIIGDSISYKDESEDTIIVPATPEANKLAMMVVAAQMRTLFQSSIKNYKDKEIQLTPDELKKLAEAAKAISSFSGEVYGSSAFPTHLGGSKGKESASTGSLHDLSFESLTAKPPKQVVVVEEAGPEGETQPAATDED